MSARIELRDISASLGQRTVLKDVSASFTGGEIVGLVGPNGAGKSTLLRAIAGLQTLMSGQILLDGEDLQQFNHRARAAAIAYLPQVRPVAWNITAEDLAALGRFASGGGRYARLAPLDRSCVDAALEKAGAAAFTRRPVHTLSGGEQARVHLARILASPAQTLLLDEPCAALDIRHQLDLMQVLNAEATAGRTIIAALHDLALAERYCDRVLVLDQGKLVSTELTDQLLADVFGVARVEGGGFRTS